MEVVTGSILPAIFEVVFDRLLSTDWLKYVGEGKVLDQLKKWEKKLKKINLVLSNAEMQSNNELVEMWLTDLKNLAYDLEDVLDEMVTEVQQRHLEDQNCLVGRPSPSTVRRILPSCCFAVKPTTIMFNVDMVSKIDEMDARLDEIIKEKDELNLLESNIRSGVTQASDSRLTTSVVNEARVYGRSKDKKAVLELMNKAAVGGANVAVIPIIGMGGLGKTTLAQLIYKDTSLQFDFKAWVCVGDGVDFNVRKITKEILNSNEEDLNSLQVELEKKLRGQKFLIILDDLWSNDYEAWTRLCGPFESGAPGSTIIVTTRLRNVANMTAGTLDTTHELKELSDDECLPVFCQHAFGATNFDHLHMHLKTTGQEIVKRCKGLPLAAKALGGLLRGKFNTDEWEEILKSSIWDLRDNNILPALRLSYFYLPPHLKRCFAYCSIFPQDYEFDRDELVLLWMAEGLLCQKNKVNLGREYFEELLARSFFQRSNDNSSRYVMHDLINELALFVSRDTCFHLGENESAGVESYANIRHSSFIPRRYNVSRRFECFYKMMKLRTFLSPGNRDERKYLHRKVLYHLLPKLKCLRVLSLSHYEIEELPSFVGELKLLRYLDLSYTDITKLPESIGKLFHLETLKLNGCKILIELPKSISDLTNLLYLDISGETWSLKKMPPGIGNLKSLRMLSKFIVGEENDGLKISELKKLAQLAGKLEIEELQNVEDMKDENLIKEKPGLIELQFKWEDRRVVNSNIEDEQVLKSLEPNQNAASVSISGYGGRQFPSWVGDPIFSKMVKVELLSCKLVKLLPPLGRLSSLKVLSMQGLNAVEEIGSEFYGDDSFFPCLEALEIKDMSEWKQWSWCDALNEDSVRILNKLRKLIIRNCPKLIGKLPSCIPSLKELEISGCPQLIDLPGVLTSLKKLCVCGSSGSILRNLTNLPCLTELKIERMEGLLTLEERYLQSMTALEKLEISECNELKCLLAYGTHLDYLKHLKINRCEKLVSLVNVEGGFLPLNLEYLEISHCEGLKDINLNGLNSLKNLDNCSSVSCFPNGDSLTSLTIRYHLLESFHNYGFCHLTNLEIMGCHELESFPERELPNIPTLMLLSIWNCKRLKSLTNHMQSFPNLQTLMIGSCDELESFPESGLPNHSLVFFNINCKNLRSLPNQMQSLTSLQYLHIYFTEISSLQGFLPPKLTVLVIGHPEKFCQTIAEWGLHTLTSLRRLTIESNSDMVSFPGVGLLLPTSLTSLKIYDFENVKSISRGIQNLTSLQELYIGKCPKLKSFPPVESLPPALEYIEIGDCPHLKDWCSKDKGEYGPIIRYEWIANP